MTKRKMKKKINWTRRQQCGLCVRVFVHFSEMYDDVRKKIEWIKECAHVDGKRERK